MELSVQELKEFSKGEFLTSKVDADINKLSTDTRKIEKGNVFLALKGANFNGNEYAEKALMQGAEVCIIDEVLFDTENVKDKVIIKVEDTKKALLDIAHGYRNKLGIKVVGITGSTGKTSTKDLTTAFLGGKYKVFKTKGNFNNEIGMPLMILELDSSYDIAVLEMGMSDFNEIHNLVNCARPDIALMTNIGISHIETLKTRDNILKAKMEITDFFNKENVLIVNGEDDKLQNLESKEYKIVKTGYNSDYECFATDIDANLENTSFTLNHNGKQTRISLDMVGKHNVLNALLGIEAGFKLGLTIEEMVKGLKTLEATSMRLEFIDGKTVNIINDCYNASPDSMESGLDVLKMKSGRKVAILGTMLQLGDEAKKAHREVGEYAKDIADLLIVTGDFKEDFKEGFEKESVKLYNTKVSLIDDLKNVIKSGDNILVKASRGEKYEDIVRELKNI
ncbi:UDP-N-acetylmuramoyl-tripeptide--D-alanyl-D-alanine ligase [uncultured Clostridium sp.]|uniref:UDP-N-acetylmuramoyl-tripeptide--D-alanyl-D- alanine ligase n=1 Tax=uncultured Clostridium sp. TaxID=59620 RepID=UPI00263826F5|nr:UDP-N-acetylmuramoyl-tripeptide--D-alanyl-D-alanine ligase [uncultured Clostridium sp.]